MNSYLSPQTIEPKKDLKICLSCDVNKQKINVLIESQPPPLDNWFCNGNSDINKQ